MAVLHALLVLAAFAGVAIVPCALGLLIIAVDETSERCWRALRRGYRRGAGRLGTRLFADGVAHRWRLARIARALRVEPQLERSQPTSPPIQQVAADLRRLSRQRLSIATRSKVWFTAVQRAYDDRLGVACGQLGIEEHLSEVAGVDLDLERVRVEGLLEAAGLVFRDDGAESRNRRR